MKISPTNHGIYQRVLKEQWYDLMLSYMISVIIIFQASDIEY